MLPVSVISLAVFPRRGNTGIECAAPRALTGGPVAKSFCANFASEYPKLAAQATRPGNLVAADPEIRELVDRLNRDAGFEPIHVGGLEMARGIEDFRPLLIGIARNGLGPFFYRVSPTAA